MKPPRDGGSPSGRPPVGRKGPAEVLLDLARDEALRSGGGPPALRRIAEAASTALGCSRVSIWLYDDQRTAITCSDLYERSSDSHSSGAVLLSADYPRYFKALESERTLAAHDARADPRTSEFRDGYLDLHDINSMLDVPIRLGGLVKGVVCHEHVGPARRWTPEEEAFGGSIADFAALAMERAERRAAERALRESRERERQLLDSTAEAIFGVDLEGCCTFCNASCLEMLGHEIDSDLLGANMHELIHHHAADGAVLESEDCGITRALRSGEPLHVRTEIFWRADGSSFPVEYRSHSVRRDGEVVGCVVTFLDISTQLEEEHERRELEERSHHAQRLESLSILAGGVAHDFNNMLMAVIGNLALATEDLEEGSPAREGIEQAEKAALRAAGLAQQLLAFSGGGGFALEQVHLPELIREMLSLLRSSLAPDVRLETQLPDELLPVRADATQLRQVVMNLVLNASEALGGLPGVVRVELATAELDEAGIVSPWASASASPGRHLVLRVSDSGSGMDPETKRRVFDPFFSTKFAGRGLGLAAVLGIVRGHGGLIRVDSEPERGTTFEVCLPVASEPAAEVVVPSRVSVGGRSFAGRLLVVDDDVAVLTVTRRILEKAGYKVVTAVDGRQAVEIVEGDDEGFDAILLDLTMPVLSGEEACYQILELRPGSRILLSSGFTEGDMESRFGDRGPAGFIQKPYRPERLLARLEELRLH